jgi:hypothetical protein
MFMLCSNKGYPIMSHSLASSYHWTPLTQSGFLEAHAQTGSIKRMCAAMSMSRQATYAFRRRSDAVQNIPIQCQLPEKSAISEMPISSPLAPRAMSGHRAASP